MAKHKLDWFNRSIDWMVESNRLLLNHALDKESDRSKVAMAEMSHQSVVLLSRRLKEQYESILQEVENEES